MEAFWTRGHLLTAPSPVGGDPHPAWGLATCSGFNSTTSELFRGKQA